MKYTMLLAFGILVVVQMIAAQNTGSTGETSAPSPTNPGFQQQDAVATAKEPEAPADQPQADQPAADDQPQADQPAAGDQPQADQPVAADNQPQADQKAANQQADSAPAGDQANADAEKKKPEEEKREQTPNDAPAQPVTSAVGQISTEPGLLHNPSTVQPAVSQNSTMKQEKPTEKQKNSASGIYGSTLVGTTALAILLFSAM